MKIREQVKQFHDAMSQPVYYTPQIPSDDRVRLRLNLIIEESLEIVESCGIDVKEIKEQLFKLIRDSKLKVDLPKFVDGCGDTDYVVEGARLEFGVDGEPIANEIHAANMRKTTGPVREDGKRLKPANWFGPDIEKCLLEQGWIKNSFMNKKVQILTNFPTPYWVSGEVISETQNEVEVLTDFSKDKYLIQKDSFEEGLYQRAILID